jgi:hypothetical protein
MSILDSTHCEKDQCGGVANLPNNVAASLDPVVQESQASVGNKIGETHGSVKSM